MGHIWGTCALMFVALREIIAKYKSTDGQVNLTMYYTVVLEGKILKTETSTINVKEKQAQSIVENTNIPKCMCAHPPTYKLTSGVLSTGGDMFSVIS